MTWDEIAAQAGVALLVVREGAVRRSNLAAARLVEPFGATLPDVLDQVTAVSPDARTTTVRWPSPTGGTRWWDVACFPLAGAGLLYVIVDETERYGEDAPALGPLTAHWRLTRLETMTASGTWQWSVRDGSVLWSDSLLDLFGIPRGTRLDYAEYRELLHPDDIGMIEETLATALRTLAPFSYTHRMMLGDRVTERIFECHGEVFADAAGRAVRVLGTARDVTDAHRARQELAYLAEHDPLTGIANRRRITGRLAECAARPGCAALLLDRHRQLQGHQRPPRPRGRRPGDPARSPTPSRPGSAPDVLLGRLGGDEFAVIVPNATPAAAMELAETLCDVVGGTPVGGRVDAIAGHDQRRRRDGRGRRTSRPALAHADLALYEAKTGGPQPCAAVHTRSVPGSGVAGVGAAAGRRRAGRGHDGPGRPADRGPGVRAASVATSC